MSTTRTPSRNIKSDLPLEPEPPQGHNGRRVCGGDKPDRRIVELVKLLGRIAAEQDFRDEQLER